MRSRAVGFTLLEMLVTLVVVALVGSLLAQSLVHLARVERLLDRGSLQGSVEGMRVQWLRSLLQGLQPTGAKDADRFKGDESSLQGQSSAVPGFPAPSSSPFELAIRRSQDGERTQLLLRTGGAARNQSADLTESELLSWEGPRGRWHYLDAQGGWHDSWPPPLGPQGATLPAAVGLETGLEGMAVLFFAPVAQNDPLIRRRELEQL